MARHKVFTWPDLGRKSKTLDLAQKQIEMAIRTVTELKEAITAASEGKRAEFEDLLKTLFSHETELDDLRRLVFEELTKEPIPPKYRADLLHIVRRLDVMADQVKDSARNVKLVLGKQIPSEIWSANTRIAGTLVKEAALLGSTIKTLSITPSQAGELARRVDEQENVVDDEYLKTKALLAKSTNQLDFATILVLKDLLECMEQIADICADTADYIRVLAVAK